MTRSFISASLTLFVLFLGATGCGRTKGSASQTAAQQEAQTGDVPAELQALLGAPKAPDYVPANDEGKRLFTAIREFYKANGHQPVWMGESGPRPQATELAQAIAKAENDGLEPSSYSLPAFPAGSGGWLSGGPPARAVAEAELRSSWAALRFAAHLTNGQVDPKAVDANWYGTRAKVDLVKILQQVAQKPAEALASMTPQHPQYQALRQVLVQYHQIVERGGWPALPEGFTAKKGSRSPDVLTLRTRLAAEGDLAANAAPAAGAARPAVAPAAHPVNPPAQAQPATAALDLFDDAVAAAVTRFKGRHGLNPDAVVDARTVAALNVPARERRRQIELNLERWRWLPEKFGERYVMVNIPTYELNAFDNGQMALEMNVVTGKKDSPTPIFSDEMTTVVFSPYWNIPRDIMRDETIPEARRDPGYFAKNNLEVVRDGKVVSPWSVDLSSPGVQVRQRPGPKNSLGLVKFLFPNKYEVYLHDTPADSLFSRVTRDYSHGCVRVEDPVALAEWVLAGQPEWTSERIQAAMHSGVEKHVALKRKVPVYLVYTTVWAEADGTAQFRADVYGHDAQQEKLLPEAETPPPVRVARN